jgi:hypothetical protein
MTSDDTAERRVRNLDTSQILKTVPYIWLISLGFILVIGALAWHVWRRRAEARSP